MAFTLKYKHYTIEISHKDEENKEDLSLIVKIFDQQSLLATTNLSSELISVDNSDLYLIDDDKLLIGCEEYLVCLSLPSLNLEWENRVDDFGIIKIYRIDEGYLTHGELYITKVSKNGDKLWEFSGADIWISIKNNTDVVVLEEDGILLTDFNGDNYKIDYNGKLLWDTVRNKKPWWKFW